MADQVLDAVAVVTKFQEDGQWLLSQFDGLRDDVRKILIAFVGKIKQDFNQVPTKETLLLVLSQLVDKAIPNAQLEAKTQMNPILQILEGAALAAFKQPIIFAVLWVLDETTLSKWFGADWFEQILKEVNALPNA